MAERHYVEESCSPLIRDEPAQLGHSQLAGSDRSPPARLYCIASSAKEGLVLTSFASSSLQLISVADSF